MPQHKSAKKRVKTSLKSQMRNRAARSALRKSLKEFREMSPEDKAKASKDLQATLDKAANKGIIHENQAARLKSRLTSSS
jgi:small subunit ribosomal protein S20